jgi:hypothetical protein
VRLSLNTMPTLMITGLGSQQAAERCEWRVNGLHPHHMKDRSPTKHHEKPPPTPVTQEFVRMRENHKRLGHNHRVGVLINQDRKSIGILPRHSLNSKAEPHRCGEMAAKACRWLQLGPYALVRIRNSPSALWLGLSLFHNRRLLEILFSRPSRTRPIPSTIY